MEAAVRREEVLTNLIQDLRMNPRQQSSSTTKAASSEFSLNQVFGI